MDMPKLLQDQGLTQDVVSAMGAIVAHRRDGSAVKRAPQRGNRYGAQAQGTNTQVTSQPRRPR